jgi:hypothetical protein
VTEKLNEPEQSAPASNLPEVTPVIHSALTPAGLAALAREVAFDIRELPTILKTFKLTEAQYEEIGKIPFFQNALTSATIEWESVKGTEERIKLRSQIILEENIGIVAARMRDIKEPLNSVVETGKFFTKLAGIGEQSKSGASAGEKFVIEINLGEDTKLRFEKNTTPDSPSEVPALIEGEVVQETVRPDPEGDFELEANPEPVRPVPEGDNDLPQLQPKPTRARKTPPVRHLDKTTPSTE